VIDLYYFPSPNGMKVAIMLEECGLPYRVVPVDILRGEQFSGEYLAICPNNKIPAIVDHDAAGGPLSVFESGAVLLYLAEKSSRFLPAAAHARYDVLQWLFWQVGGLGPMAGQAHHFRAFATESNPYGIRRYTDEVNRLYGVLERRLGCREYVAVDYSIADMACWPWVAQHERQGQPLERFPAVQRWFEAIRDRPAVQRVTAVGQERMADTEARHWLYGQTADKVLELTRERASGSSS
jgi:GST-like protein